MADLTPMSDDVFMTEPEKIGVARAKWEFAGVLGFLALVGAFDDAPELPELLDEVVRTR